MGFFNFFFNFKYFLRRMPKKILVGIIVILLLFIFSTNSHAVDHVIVDNESNVDAFQFAFTRYEYNWYRLVNDAILYAKEHNNTFPTQFIDFCQKLTNTGTQYVWYIADQDIPNYFKNSNGGGLGSTTAWLYFGYCRFDTESDRSESYLTIGSSYSSTSNSSRNLLVFNYKTNATIYRQVNKAQFVNQVTDGRITIPYGLERYVPSDLYSLIIDVANNRYQFYNTDELLNSISQKIDETNEQLQNLNNFMEDDTTSEYTQNDLPSDSMNDITASSFNSIFTNVYNKMTTEDSQTVSIPIPYLNYNITISSNTIKNALINNGFSAIINIISVVWFGVISLYILKDIYRYINQIKNGDIGHTDTNIKTEVL